MIETDLTEFDALLAEAESVLAGAAPGDDDFADCVPEVEGHIRSTPRAEYAEVLESFRDDSCLEFYVNFVKDGQRRREGGNEWKVRCPSPDHPDQHPSCNINSALNVWHCHACGTGGGIFDLAAAAWGFVMPGDAWNVKRMYALRVHGLVEPANEPPSTSVGAPSEPLLRAEPGRSTGDRSGVVKALDDRAAKVAEEAERQRIHQEARELLARERSAAEFMPFEISTLDVTLAKPETKLEWAIEGVLLKGGNALLIATYKVGKTSFTVEAARCLADCLPWMGEHAVNHSGTVAYLNAEDMVGEFVERVRRVGMVRTDKVVDLHLRDVPFDFMDDSFCAYLGEGLQRLGTETLILDPYSRVQLGDADKEGDAHRLTKRLDVFKKNYGISNLIIPAHTGHAVEEGSEHVRGSSFLDGWADSRLIVTKKADGSRWIKGTVRGAGDLRERMTNFDPVTWRITYSSFVGTPQQKVADDLRNAILAIVGSTPGISQNGVYAGVTGGERRIQGMLKTLISEGELETRQGPNNTVMHYLMGCAPIV